MAADGGSFRISMMFHSQRKKGSKMKARILTLFPLLTILALGCGHAQLPPTSHNVALSWTAPVAGGGWQGCTSYAPCTYVLSRATVSGASCPATTGANYTPLNQNAPVSGLSYTDNNVAGLNVCYIAQTLQGSAVSQPSNVVGPFQVQAVPLAPNLNQPTQSEVTAPPLKPAAGNQMAMLPAPVLTAKLIPVR
jgi:hypothetical protein